MWGLHVNTAMKENDTLETESVVNALARDTVSTTRPTETKNASGMQNT